MNILFVINELSYRGTPRCLVNCAILARQAGHQTLVWSLQEGGPSEKTCAENGIPVRIGFDALADVLAFAPRITHVHRAGGVSDRDTALLRFLKEKTGCRVLETNVFGTADLTVPDPIDLHAHVSRWDLWHWRRWFWPFRRPGIYLPNCVDTAAFRPVSSDAFRRAHGIPASAVAVGRIGKTAWTDLRRALLPALRECSNVVFVSVNDYSGETEDFTDWPADCRTRILRIPALRGPDELSAFYSACDLTLNFSPIGESFGYVVAEAMACGTPVIALSKPRNDNAQIEIAEAGYGAYPVNTPEAACQVVKDCAHTPPTAEQRTRCRESIVRRYSLDAFAPRLELAYRTLAETELRGRALEREFARRGFETDIPNREIAERLKSLINELGLANRVIFVDNFLLQDELVALTDACDAYLSLHRGEGFGIGIAEAMSLGKPVVVTDYSSTTEFCNRDDALPVPYRIEPVPHIDDGRPFYRHVKDWPEPDVHAAATALRRLYDDRAFAKELGERGRRFVADHFSDANFRKSIESFLAREA